jgi:CheY-like chemotaxis protein
MADILVVDDMEGVRKAIGSMLKRGGHNVTPAADGIKAIRLLESQRPIRLKVSVPLPVASGAAAVPLSSIRAGSPTAQPWRLSPPPTLR